jgi:hypothetical protein
MNAGEWKSFGIEATAAAMNALAESGFIEIIEQAENNSCDGAFCRRNPCGSKCH